MDDGSKRENGHNDSPGRGCTPVVRRIAMRYRVDFMLPWTDLCSNNTYVMCVCTHVFFRNPRLEVWIAYRSINRPTTTAMPPPTSTDRA